MRQPQIGNYNFTPQQMARVNAQREARGRAPLLSRSMEDQGYADDYDRYYSEIQKKKSPDGGVKKSQYDIEREEMSGVPIQERMRQMGIKSREKEGREQSAFREKFRRGKSVPSQMSGLRGAVSSPALGNYNLG